VDTAIQELAWSKKAGLVGATIWMIPPEGLAFDSDHYDRFWEAAQDLAMPVSMHINTGFGEYGEGFQRGATMIESVKRTCGGHKKVAMDTLTELICSGVFERYPQLKLVIAELEVGWIPFWLEDMDRRFLKVKDRSGFSLLPSEYFGRQVYATFTQDRSGGYLLGQYGEGNFLWSNDYPHPGCIWPYSDTVIEKTLGHLRPEARAKVLRENVAKLYGRTIPDQMSREPAPDMEPVWGRLWINKD
jgi:predicted TIM-barrel fold metal-dependent hydrolase